MLFRPIEASGHLPRLHRAAVLACAVAVLSSIGVAPTLAHSATDVAGGLEAGLLHPLYGLDHVVAMVAVGLWGAFVGPPAIWLLPIVFPMVMAVGGAMGVIGIPIPFIEVGIAVSAIVLGLMVAFAVRPPLWIAALLVGAFAVFHGHAHGTELPGAANPLAYSIGFVVSTGLLHLAGIALGLLAKWPAGRIIVRAGGALISAAGVSFLVT
jgi:urease accessory protein